MLRATKLIMRREVRVEEVCPCCEEQIGERDVYIEGMGGPDEVATHRRCGGQFIPAPGPEYRPESLSDLGREMAKHSAPQREARLTRWRAAGGTAIAEDFEPIDAAMGKKGKKCPCGQRDATGNCACGYGWAFAPLYGDGEGHSGATTPPDNVSDTGGQTPSPSSPAYPGAGGVNSPSVPAGPNSGMGIVASRPAPRGLAFLSEALDYAIHATSIPTLADAPPEFGGPLGPMVDDEEPAGIEPLGPTVGSILVAAVHRAFTQAGDVLFAHGYMSQEDRIALSGCVGDALGSLNAAMAERCARAAAAPVTPNVMPQCFEAIERLEYLTRQGEWSPELGKAWSTAHKNVQEQKAAAVGGRVIPDDIESNKWIVVRTAGGA